MRVAALVLLLCVQGACYAQPAWPARPVHVYVGSPAGGAPDLLARILVEPVSQALGQPILVEPKPGAGGNIAADTTAKAAPDGYTFMLSNNGAHGIAPSLYKSLPFDAVKDFAAVARAVELPIVLYASAKLPVRQVKDLIDYAKARPRQLNYGSTGLGTIYHLTGALFESTAGLEMTHVPYKATADLQQALIEGTVHVAFLNRPPTKGLVALGVASPSRFREFPDVPTLQEGGLDLNVSMWFGFFAPARTPGAIVGRFAEEVGKSLKSRDVAERLQKLGATPAMLGSREFESFYRADIARWAKIVKASGATAD